MVAFELPYVHMTQHNAEKTLLLQLLELPEGDTELESLSRGLVKGAKRISHDADTRRLLLSYQIKWRPRSGTPSQYRSAVSVFSFCVLLLCRGSKALPRRPQLR